MLVLITDGANNGGEIEPKVAARLAAEQKVKIYTIGIGSDPQQSGIMGMLGLNPGVDLDEATLIDIAEQTGGAYFRARTSEELQRIEETLDQLATAAQLPTRAVRPRLCIPGRWLPPCWSACCWWRASCGRSAGRR